MVRPSSRQPIRLRSPTLRRGNRLRSRRPGTLEWAWLLYKQSGAWQSGIGKATRRQRENIMKHVLKNAGSQPLSKIDSTAIRDGVDRRARTPSQAKNFKQTMSQFFAWLKEAKIVKENPCDGVALPKRPRTGGFKEWTEEDVLKYEKRWPIGTRQRVMLDVYMYTGLRRGDAASVGKQHIAKQTVMERDEATGAIVPRVKEVISLATEKSQRQTVVHLPLLDVLKRTLEAGQPATSPSFAPRRVFLM